MGGCLSGGSSGGGTYVDQIDGTDEDFHSRYFEDRVLGQGEFGVVKLVHDMQTSNGTNNNINASNSSADHREPLACKIIRKGMIFKDNTLYAPLKPEVLKMECDILRALAGEHYCLKLCGIYESSKLVYILTEYCSGGDMLKYVVSVHGDEEDASSSLRSEDVSRIAFQLLDAIHHCAKHRVIHRDIKPDNVMFRHPTPGAELRLIDFGSGTMDSTAVTTTPEGKQPSLSNELQVHTTFAGSGFYISPELYHKEYTCKTDVWSAGVVLYVLVAGYPADDLQKAFNLLQKPKRNLRKLPNLPHNLPDSFYDLLEGLLVYNHENRKGAGEFLSHDFVQFHQHLLEEEDEMILTVEQIAAEAAGAKLILSESGGDNTTNERKRLGRNASVALSGSVARHTIFLGYQKFERAVTTLLAALLTKPELDVLLKTVAEKIEQLHIEEEAIEVDQSASDAIMRGKKKLHIVAIHQLKTIIKELNHERALSMIDKLPDASLYDHYAYHLALLRQFAREANDGKGGRRRGTSRKYSIEADADSSNSNRSTGSLKTFRSSAKNDTLERQPRHTSSVHGNNVYEGWKAGKLQNPRRPPPQRSPSVPLSGSMAQRDPTL